MRLRTSVAVLPVLLAAACASDGSTIHEPLENLVAAPCERPAPLLGHPDSRVTDSYIVVFTGAVTDAAAATYALAEHYGFTPSYVYDHALEGFAAVMSAETVASIRCEANVDFVEYDAVMWLDDQ